MRWMLKTKADHVSAKLHFKQLDSLRLRPDLFDDDFNGRRCEISWSRELDHVGFPTT